jgi:hypothetical protein
MKIGSEAHKELFCRSFMESHLKYEPEKLPWPQLDGVGLERLRGIPFWEKALDTEREAGALVSAYAETVSDPVLREAIALQGVEEARHAMIQAFGESDTSGAGFTATGASAFAIELTPEMFLSACVQANARRMSRFDDRLLQPQLIPALATAALRTLQFFSRLKPKTGDTQQGTGKESNLKPET